MNEQLQKMAEQAGLSREFSVSGLWLADDRELERFAELVRQDERERLLGALQPVGVFAYDEENKVWEELLPNIEGIPLYALPAELAKPDVALIGEGNKQEPVCDKDPSICGATLCQLGKVCKHTPQRKPWVGLTDDEVFEFLLDGVDGREDINNIEELLRRKNNG
jgi:hypothetical protein